MGKRSVDISLVCQRVLYVLLAITTLAAAIQLVNRYLTTSIEKQVQEPERELSLPNATSPQPQPQLRCEVINSSVCTGLSYNKTLLPNLVGQDTQTDAESLLRTFGDLIRSGCSAQLKPLVCSVYLPKCTDEVSEPVRPCRDYCQSVVTECEPVLNKLGIAWPRSLNCDRFHNETIQESICFSGEQFADEQVLRE